MGKRMWTVHMDDRDILESLHLGGRAYAFACVIDVDDACGRENEGNPRYLAECKVVDLSELSPDDIKSALRSYGMRLDEEEGVVHDYSGDIIAAPGDPSFDLVLAELCQGYGCYAPAGSEYVGSCSGPVKWRPGARREARRVARRMARATRDEDKRADMMERPVNKIGSTAREYMTGDMNSAILRGIAAGDPDAEIMARMGMLR